MNKLTSFLRGIQPRFRTTETFQQAAASQHDGVTWWMLVAALSSFGAFALGVLYIRLFSLVFSSSTYTFGIVLAMSLAGLKLGAWLVSSMLRRCAPEQLISVASWLAAIGILSSVRFFVWMTSLKYVAIGNEFVNYLLGGPTFAVAIIVLPPATLLGLFLPAMWTASLSRAESGRDVGHFAAVNTLAAAAGAVAASVLFLPSFGLWLSFGLVAVFFSAVAACAFIRRRKPGCALLCGVAFLVCLVSFLAKSEFWAEYDYGSIVVTDTKTRRFDLADVCLSEKTRANNPIGAGKTKDRKRFDGIRPTETLVTVACHRRTTEPRKDCTVIYLPHLRASLQAVLKAEYPNRPACGRQ